MDQNEGPLKMKWVLSFCALILGLLPVQVHGQSDSLLFDFWVGEWRVEWTESGTAGKGRNTVSKILDNSVIQENFRTEVGPSKGYKGTSISVFNSNTKTWHQGYADNQGSYFNFVGERDGERRIFRTAMRMDGEKKIIQRMVFYDIQPDKFTWDWESTVDGGKTWNLNWRIFYTRVPQ